MVDKSSIDVPAEADALREALKRTDLSPKIRTVMEDALGTKAQGNFASLIQGGMIHKAYRMLTGQIPVGSVRPKRA